MIYNLKNYTKNWSREMQQFYLYYDFLNVFLLLKYQVTSKGNL